MNQVIKHFAGRRKQQGQVLPIAMFLLLIICASVLFMFNSGQMVQEKIRLTNAGDASVYAGALKMTRMLNFNSLTNRAMVINSMNIGHAVGIASWIEQTETAMNEISDFDEEHDQTILYQVYGPQAVVVKSLLSASKQTYMKYLAMAMRSHWGSQKVLSNTQGTILDAKEPEGAAYRDFGSVIRQVRKFNRLNYALEDGLQDDDEGDKEAEGGSDDEMEFYAKLLEVDRADTHADVLYDFDWSHDVFNTGFQKRGENESLDRMIEVTLNEREQNHEFLTDRGWTSAAVYLLRIGPYTIPIPGVVKKRGSTEFVGDQMRGQAAVDSLSIHWAGMAENKFGWGHVYSNDEIDDEGKDYADSKSDNPQAHDEALKDGSSPNPFPQDLWYDELKQFPQGAIPNYAELGPGMMGKEDPIFNITGRNHRKMKATRTIAGDNSLNSNSIKPTGRLELYEGNLKENEEMEYSSIASAQAIFERPVEREDGRTEIGNMFNPYWHVRWVNVSDENREKAQQHFGELNGLEITIPSAP